MPNRIGFGRGFGFRGCSPAWPHVGRGRGGLPRCAAFGIPYEPQTAVWQTTVPETEISILRNQSQNMKYQLNLIEARIKNLEQKKEGKEQ
jgi:hypothetical protein